MIQRNNKKKEVRFEPNALKEFEEFPLKVRREFNGLIGELEDLGELREPDAKKLNKNLFELRVKVEGNWRSVYAYFEKDYIYILACFRKKTQKTPKNIIKLALKRYKKL